LELRIELFQDVIEIRNSEQNRGWFPALCNDEPGLLLDYLLEDGAELGAR